MASAGVGHEFFADCVAAVEAAARAPHAEHLSVSALHLLQAVARRLAASGPEVGSPLCCKCVYAARKQHLLIGTAHLLQATVRCLAKSRPAVMTSTTASLRRS